MEEVDAFFSEEVFFRDIDVKSSPHGAQFALQVQAETSLYASQVALYVVEQMLHVLGTKSNTAFVVSRQDARLFSPNRSAIKRTIDANEWQYTFRETHHLLHKEPAFLRALGAYHRALSSENPIERFGRFFHAMTCVVAPSIPEVARGEEVVALLERGLQELWGEPSQWPHLGGGREVLDEWFALYLMCRHGVGTITPSSVARVIEPMERLHRISHAFLTEWRNRKIEVPGEFYHMSIHHDTGWGHILQ